MPGDVVNLRSFRKAKARSEKDAAAEANRAKFGRTKAERADETARREREARSLEGHRRERDENG
jgi:hypothetical protein